MPSSSMQAISKTARTDPQTNSLLFRIPAELRNEIYFHLFEVDPQTSDGPFRCFSWKRGRRYPPWDREHRSHRIPLRCARRHAPSNALLASCRILYHEAKSIFFGAQRDFWRKTSFTISLKHDGGSISKRRGESGPNLPPLIDYPCRLSTEQVEAIACIVIKTDQDPDTRIHLISGFGPNSASWHAYCVCKKAGRFDPGTWRLREARKQALAPDRLEHTRDRLSSTYEQARSRVNRSAGFDNEGIRVAEEEGKRLRRLRESVVMFEKGQRSMKRLDLTVIIEHYCDEWGVAWKR